MRLIADGLVSSKKKTKRNTQSKVLDADKASDVMFALLLIVGLAPLIILLFLSLS